MPRNHRRCRGGHRHFSMPVKILMKVDFRCCRCSASMRRCETTPGESLTPQNCPMTSRRTSLRRRRRLWTPPPRASRCGRCGDRQRGLRHVVEPSYACAAAQKWWRQQQKCSLWATVLPLQLCRTRGGRDVAGPVDVQACTQTCNLAAGALLLVLGVGQLASWSVPLTNPS